MEYRDLGKTGMRVSVVGLGGGPLGSCRTDYGVKIVEKALDLGVNYFDTARGYWDSEIKLGIALKGCRDSVYVSSKTHGRSREEAWRDINESLERLQTDYLDNCHLHGLQDKDDLDARLGPGGAIEALTQARNEGMIKNIGCTSHASRELLIDAVQRFDFDIILVPMNIVEREPLDRLIPICREKRIGVTIMKPLATGLVPAVPALKWLMSQPVSTVVPGASTIEEVTENSIVGNLADFSLASDEQETISYCQESLDNVRCRLCYRCEPCPVGIPIAITLGTDVIYDHFRTMGPEAFASFPWSEKRVADQLEPKRQLIEMIEACDECGLCRERCSYGLPVPQMLKKMLPELKQVMAIWETSGYNPS